MTNKILSYLCIGLLVAQLVLFLVSWLLSALRIEGIKSLLSGEGIRWYVGHFGEIVAQPFLVWLLLIFITLGVCRGCGFHLSTSRSYRERVSLRMATIATLGYIAVITYLVLSPSAILLSATGKLLPSPFISGILPIITLAAIIFSVTYGVTAGRFRTAESIFAAMRSGLERGTPWIISYIFVISIYESMRFVLA